MCLAPPGPVGTGLDPDLADNSPMTSPVLDNTEHRKALGATGRMERWFRRLGLQRRIMLYVVVGLAAMFTVVAILGLDAIDQATQLVYRERLMTAHTTAGILEHDLDRVAAGVMEAAPELFPETGSRVPPGAAERLLSRLAENGALSPYFGISGVWIFDEDGQLLEEVGEPQMADPHTQGLVGQLRLAPADAVTVLPGIGTVAGELPFVAVVVAGERDSQPVVVVHTVSVNRTEPYVPADHGQFAGVSTDDRTPAAAAEEYHLEVVGPDGMTVLGIGPDERPGEGSPHFGIIQRLMETGAAATLLHQPDANGNLEPHVMAAVPLGSSSLYVVLEQPVDVALALPQQLRDRLFLWIGIGFGLTLLVAWITTRHVVIPTEQLTRAAERMAGGDLASPIDVPAQDEVGQLAESLETMRRRLRAANEVVEKTNRELESRVADRTARLDQVLRQTISAQEEERRRLARELHDETAQDLAALAIALDRARDALTTNDASPEARERIHESREIAERLLEETRRLILGLRPSVLDDLGLLPAIRWLVETGLADQDIETSITADQVSTRLPGHVEVTLFRVVQEAVTNVARHAHAKHVSIEFSVAGSLARVRAIDDGRGFDVHHATRSNGGRPGVGLVGMEERVRLLGGKMEIISQEGGGTQVVAEVPIVPESS
jgi:signal transduction histidine kinase